MTKSQSTKDKHPIKKYPTIAVCGLDCGFCPRFYTIGSSRCPGCAGIGFFEKHPSCSFITCCVRNKRLEVCSDCSEFPCNKFKSPEVYEQSIGSSSYPSYKKVFPNLLFIQKYGIKKFIEGQNKRIKILRVLISEFDDGRSRSYYCNAALLKDITILKESIEKAKKIIRTEKIKQTDKISKAKILKSIMDKIPLADR